MARYALVGRDWFVLGGGRLAGGIGVLVRCDVSVC